jgi:putative resolvase
MMPVPILLALLKDSSITHILVEHNTRLTRFGFRYLETLLELQDGTIEVVNLTDNDWEDLLADPVSIVHGFAAQLSGPRRAKRKTEVIVKQLKAEEDTERLHQQPPDRRGRKERR